MRASPLRFSFVLPPSSCASTPPPAQAPRGVPRNVKRHILPFPPLVAQAPSGMLRAFTCLKRGACASRDTGTLVRSRLCSGPPKPPPHRIRLQVHRSFRRRGIATALLDTARSTLVYGFVFPKQQVQDAPPQRFPLFVLLRHILVSLDNHHRNPMNYSTGSAPHLEFGHSEE